MVNTRILRKLLTVICIIGLCLFTITSLSPQTYADNKDHTIDTIFFGKIKDDGKGCGVFTVLNYVIDVLAFGIGIAAAVGITIAGITYLTAKGDEAKTTKAKSRIREMVIGVAIFVSLWAILSFLLPGGVLNLDKGCKSAQISNPIIATSIVSDNLD